MLIDKKICFSMSDFWSEHQEEETIIITDVANWVANKLKDNGINVKYINPQDNIHIIALPNLSGEVPENGYTLGFYFTTSTNGGYTTNLVTSSATFSCPSVAVNFKDGEYVSYTGISTYYISTVDSKSFTVKRDYSNSTNINKTSTYNLCFNFLWKVLDDNHILFCRRCNSGDDLSKHKLVNGVILCKGKDIITNKEENCFLSLFHGYTDGHGDTPNCDIISETKGYATYPCKTNGGNDDPSIVNINELIFKSIKFDLFYTYGKDNTAVNAYFNTNTLQNTGKILRNGIIVGEDCYGSLLSYWGNTIKLLFKNTPEVEL